MNESVAAALEDDLDRARAGDAAAFDRLVVPLRRELHAHCYRMLGSVHDAEDALQDALLRAWRAIGRFDGRRGETERSGARPGGRETERSGARPGGRETERSGARP